MDDLALYDYHLPPELIASEPLPQRDAARLLVVDRRRGTLTHRGVRDLPELLQPGDCLVLNDTQVIPARLFGRRRQTGGKWEGLYLDSRPDGDWRVIGQTRGRLREGEQIVLVPAHAEQTGDEFALTLIEREPDGVLVLRPSAVGRISNPSDSEPDDPRSLGRIENPSYNHSGDVLDVLRRFGTVPLPPYIRRKLATGADWQRYQTTYSRRPGAVAAPTAGLHFTPELLAACRERGIGQAWVTLHVGIGTFRPIAVEKLSEHRMHSEWCELSAETAETLTATRRNGGRIVAIGTTSVRTLESAARSGSLQPYQGETDLFIRPPYEFQAVDGLLTNFHLPKSTLLVLISAFAGLDLVRSAYAAAIRERYRFFSYGDAMLLL